MKQTTTVMSTYKIKVRETRAETVQVIAESKETAIDRVQEAYRKGEINFDVKSVVFNRTFI